MLWFVIIAVTILLLLIVFWIFCWFMDSLPAKKQNEIFEKIDNWIDNFWK